MVVFWNATLPPVGWISTRRATDRRAIRTTVVDGMIQRDDSLRSLVEKRSFATMGSRCVRVVPREFRPGFHKRSQKDDVWVDGTDPR